MFDLFQVAIDKALVVEEKQMRRENNQSFAFLKGLELTSRREPYEASYNEQSF